MSQRFNTAIHNHLKTALTVAISAISVSLTSLSAKQFSILQFRRHPISQHGIPSKDCFNETSYTLLFLSRSRLRPHERH
ncbi:hypothetical protein HDV64DRAFT_233498 [Trichoderma sp. TUCIM 5745]